MKKKEQAMLWSLWQQGKMPCLNGTFKTPEQFTQIVFSEGLHRSKVQRSDYNINVGCIFDIKVLKHERYHNYDIYCGEGFKEGYGFCAVINVEKHNFEWFFFHDKVKSITNFLIIADQLYLCNNDNNFFIFNLKTAKLLNQNVKYHIIDIYVDNEQKKEDLIQISYSNKVILDMGWYETAYIIFVIKNNDWQNPLLTLKFYNKNGIDLHFKQAESFIYRLVY